MIWHLGDTYGHRFIDTGMGTHPGGKLTVLRVKDFLQAL